MACAIGGTDPHYEQTLAATARVQLKSSSAEVTQTSDTKWTLAKTGTVNTTTGRVNWDVIATQGATVAGRLVVTGTMTVENKGTGGATIGNIVVNLQTKQGPHWTTRSSDIADATSDDAATSAHVVPNASSENRSFFTENAASGSLQFMDASTNTLFALVPQVTVLPHETKTLRFSATYNNNVLNLAAGTPIRTEIIVSFGNASSHGPSESNIDINGNGEIDPDEANVRSVKSRFTLAVPAQLPANTQVQITDGPADITTTGTVTFTNPIFDFIGQNFATVSVLYNGGANGGTITNCAHLTSVTSTPTVNGINLTACDTQVIGPHTCTPGAPGCGWEENDMRTWSQLDWGATPSGSNAAALLVANFNSVYPGGLEVGLLGTAGFSMLFADASSTLIYLPASGAPGALNADLVNPSSSSSGLFGGLVVALELNIRFSDATVLPGVARFGDLLLCRLSATPALSGMTVRQFLGVANQALGGGAAPYPIDPTLTSLVGDLDLAFEGGTPSVFAQDHLFNGSCPP